MKESLYEAKDELKRVDHQIYVSLKYTRTVDVLMNCIGRMIDSYNCLIDALLKFSVEKKMRREEFIPTTPLERGELVKELFKDEIVQKNMESYFLLRKTHKSIPKKEQEFRRHVTLRVMIDNKEITFDIDKATEYYLMIKEFYDWIEAKINE
ncbi:hypothetical protein JW756_02120 [Candidatus Woesearchaeota archaeon]|nr:hypothetical protein [Candidatus Woesearchaeota archaeon]